MMPQKIFRISKALYLFCSLLRITILLGPNYPITAGRLLEGATLRYDGACVRSLRMGSVARPYWALRCDNKRSVDGECIDR